MEQEILDRVYQFFVESSDFNGIPLRQISDKLDISYEESIDILQGLVRNELLCIQKSVNPNIILYQHLPSVEQIEILEQTKKNVVTTHALGNLTYQTENAKHSICVYPSNKFLKVERNLEGFGNSIYTKKLAIGEAQLNPYFFEIEVLYRYANDPRFEFIFEDYSGSISYKTDVDNESSLKPQDQIFLQSFGLGINENGNRMAVVYLRYLKGLSGEHQIYWQAKEATGNCKMVSEYNENNIENLFSTSHSIFTAFIEELKTLNVLAVAAFNKKIFRNSFDDNNRPREFTFFFTPTLKNYNDFVSLLDKMISENINKDFFTEELELFDIKEIEDGVKERRQKGTLRLLEEWLSIQYRNEMNDEVKDLLKSFRQIRKQRQSPAHKIYDNHYDKKYIDMQKKIIKDAYYSIRILRQIFQQHEKAKKVKILNWLDNGNIKEF